MPGRRERKKEMTRQALLEASIALFADRGFDGTRIEDITERIDLAKGAFYNYFESKEALLAELIFEGIGILEHDNLTTSTDEQPGGLVQGYWEFLNHHPEYLSLIHQALGLLMEARGGNERLRGSIGHLLRRLTSGLSPLGGSRQWTDDECLDMAALVTGGVTGYRAFRLAAGYGPATAAVQRAITAGLVHMMGELKRSGGSAASS